ncbi:4Fe4S-binding leucine-rich repeat protein [Methylocystis sp. JAN1]|uniref:4Fe4S-binding leucine-rich repeat protein n=1 Tax=Methylocystis sp. JAN1 TaxID=3397211 RepID=UPI003FA323B7
MSTDDIDEAIDWRGAPVDCAECAHQGRLTEAKCKPLRACVHDRYARRIDRFFDWNPDLARDYVAHDYFEVRACAAKAAEIFLLPAMLDDPEEAVRWSAARRLPRRHILRLRNDPHREVRIRIAGRLEGADLLPMMKDEDYAVRQAVARKLSPDLLVLMINDADPGVRRTVASRIEHAALMRLAGDTDPVVRLEAAKRLEPADLKTLLKDVDWRVRYEVAQRAEANEIGPLFDDEDPLVRECARSRFKDAGLEPPTNVIVAQTRSDP